MSEPKFFFVNILDFIIMLRKFWINIITMKSLYNYTKTLDLHFFRHGQSIY